EGGLDDRADIAAGAGVENGFAAGVDRAGEIVGQELIVSTRDPDAGVLAGGTAAVMDANLGTRFADDQRAFAAEQVEPDLADVGVTGLTDAAQADAAEQSALHFERDGGEIVDVIVGVGLV